MRVAGAILRGMVFAGMVVWLVTPGSAVAAGPSPEPGAARGRQG